MLPLTLWSLLLGSSFAALMSLASDDTVDDEAQALRVPLMMPLSLLTRGAGPLRFLTDGTLVILRRRSGLGLSEVLASAVVGKILALALMTQTKGGFEVFSAAILALSRSHKVAHIKFRVRHV